MNTEVHKIRFDRGRNYYSYVQAPLTAFLVWAFATQDWWIKIVYGCSTIVLIYIMGLVDESTRILHREQKRLSDMNPVIVEMMHKLIEIERKLDEKNCMVDGHRRPNARKKPARRLDLAPEADFLQAKVEDIDPVI